MRFILHQLWNDLRRFRLGLLALWLTLAAGCFTPDLLPPGDPALVSSVIFLVTGTLVAGLLTAMLVQSHPLTGSTAFWMTRPIRRAHLFAARSAFLAVGVVGPCLVIQFVVARTQGLEAGSTGLLIAGTAMLACLFCLLIATLASYVQGMTRFIILLAGVSFGWFLWLGTFQFLMLTGVIQRDYSPMGHYAEPVRIGLAGAVTLGCVLGAWLLHGLAGWLRPSAAMLTAGLLAFLPLAIWMPLGWIAGLTSRFYKPLPIASHATITLMEPKEIASPATGQVVLANFLVQGLRPREFAFPLSAIATIETTNHQTLHIQHQGVFNVWGDLTMRGTPEFLEAVQRHFPPETFWSGNYEVFASYSHLPILGAYSGPSEVQGDFSGRMDLGVYLTRHISALPLRPGSISLGSGSRLELARVGHDADGILIDLTEIAARVWLSPDPALREWSSYGKKNFFFVLAHEPSGEAHVALPQMRGSYSFQFLRSERRTRLMLKFPLPAAQARLAGIPLEQWEREARLHVFVTDLQGIQTFSWNREHHKVALSRVPLKTGTREGMQAIRDATLPSQPTPEQVNRFLDTLLRNMPQAYHRDDATLIEQKLKALSPSGIDTLMGRWPHEAFTSHALRNTLKRVVTAENLPAIREALRRDSRIAWLPLEKNWSSNVVDILIAALPQRRQALSGDALMMLAATRPTGACSDLLWHYAHLERGQEFVAPMLEFCPAAQRREAYNLAWKRARFGLVEPGQVALAAATVGNVEALDKVIDQLENGTDDVRQKRWLDTLRPLMPDAPPGSEMRSWLSAHRGAFRWAADPGRYVVSAGPGTNPGR